MLIYAYKTSIETHITIYYTVTLYNLLCRGCGARLRLDLVLSSVDMWRSAAEESCDGDDLQGQGAVACGARRG